MTERPSVRAELADYAIDMAKILGTLVIDSLFLIAAAYFSWAAGLVLERPKIEGVDKHVFTAVHWLLGLSTFGFVALRVAHDLAIALGRTVLAVRRTWKQVKG